MTTMMPQGKTHTGNVTAASEDTRWKRENFDKPVDELARTTKITAATTVKILKTRWQWILDADPDRKMASANCKSPRNEKVCADNGLPFCLPLPPTGTDVHPLLLLPLLLCPFQPRLMFLTLPLIKKLIPIFLNACQRFYFYSLKNHGLGRGGPSLFWQMKALGFHMCSRSTGPWAHVRSRPHFPQQQAGH